MNSDNSETNDRIGISRRAFLGTVAGGAAFALLRPERVHSADRLRPSILNDYIGRLCYNENPLGPSPASKTAMSEAIDLGHRYPDWYAESLKSDLAGYHGVSTSQIIAGCGATEILRLAALAFADPGSNVVCPYPSYGQFASDANFLGAIERYSSLDENHRVDLDDLAAQIDSDTSAVCITNPNNPTATVLPASDIADFVDAIPSSVTVIIDEAYHDYVTDTSHRSAIELVQQGKNVVVIRTFSKIFGLAGVRIGYAIGSSSSIASMNVWHLYATVTRISLAAAQAALTDSQHIADTLSLNQQARVYCFNNFDSMGLEYIPSETNFFMVDVGQSASYVSSQLASRDILVRSGWGMPYHLRVSTGTMQDMQSFITALQEILGGGPVEPDVPTVPSLYANYPNPASSRTCFPYFIPNDDRVRLQIFNVRGQLVRTLHRHSTAGHHDDLEWDGTDQRGNRVTNGSYFYRLNVGDFTETRRLIWMR
jgi:histidinol-phosphate aminotransferase